MSLYNFISKFVCSNSLVRLWTEIPGGHKMIHRGDSSVCMEHEILRGKTWQARYSSCQVIGVTDIVVDDFYREAINIVIKDFDD